MHIALDDHCAPCPQDVSLKQYGQIQKVVSYVHDNYFDETLRLERVAYKADMSAAHCSRLFKKVKGSSYKDYLIIVRITKAMALLHTTFTNVGEIAFQVGFQDVTNFCRAFKSITGHTPSEYRDGLHQLYKEA